MPFVLNLVLRILLFIFAGISLGIAGSLIEGTDGNSPQLNFNIFVPTWTYVFGVFYPFLALFIEGLAFPIVIAILDFLTWVFAFAGATALAVKIRVHSCTNHDFLESNDLVQNSTPRCRKLQVLTCFNYFIFVVSLIAFGVSVVTVFHTGALTLPTRRRSPPRTGVPTMTQV